MDSSCYLTRKNIPVDAHNNCVQDHIGSNSRFIITGTCLENRFSRAHRARNEKNKGLAERHLYKMKYLRTIKLNFGIRI